MKKIHEWNCRTKTEMQKRGQTEVLTFRELERDVEKGLH